MIFYTMLLALVAGCNTDATKQGADNKKTRDKIEPITLTVDEANRLATLPIHCIQQLLPYKPGVVIPIYLLKPVGQQSLE